MCIYIYINAHIPHLSNFIKLIKSSLLNCVLKESSNKNKTEFQRIKDKFYKNHDGYTSMQCKFRRMHAPQV